MTQLNIDKIPANTNSINNGFEDPTPEKGDKGKTTRTIISWIKGFFIK